MVLGNFCEYPERLGNPSCRFIMEVSSHFLLLSWGWYFENIHLPYSQYPPESCFSPKKAEHGEMIGRVSYGPGQSDPTIQVQRPGCVGHTDGSSQDEADSAWHCCSLGESPCCRPCQSCTWQEMPVGWPLPPWQRPGREPEDLPSEQLPHPTRAQTLSRLWYRVRENVEEVEYNLELIKCLLETELTRKHLNCWRRSYSGFPWFTVITVYNATTKTGLVNPKHCSWGNIGLGSDREEMEWLNSFGDWHLRAGEENFF